MPTIGRVLQSAAAATGVGNSLPIQDDASCTMTVSGTFVGTITFEGTEDGTTWVSLLASKAGTSGVPSTTATTPGDYTMAVPNLGAVRANITAYTSGTITVHASASAQPYIPPPGSVGTVTVAGLPAGLGQSNMAGSTSMTMASDQTAIKVNTQGGIAGTAVLANVAASIAAGGVAIQAANANRKGLTVVNDSASANLYLAYAGTVSATSYTEIVYPGQTWEMPATLYSGLIQGIWSAAVGTARVTEIS